MAYNNFFPAGYQYYQPQGVPQQTQGSGFVSVPSEDIVNTYPVAPGNCVTFKIEGKPIVMEKSMGFSQLESPRIERYRLVKEEPETVATTETLQQDYGPEIKRLWAEIEDLKQSVVKSARRKKEVEDAES